MQPQYIDHRELRGIAGIERERRIQQTILVESGRVFDRLHNEIVYFWRTFRLHLDQNISSELHSRLRQFPQADTLAGDDVGNRISVDNFLRQVRFAPAHRKNRIPAGIGQILIAEIEAVDRKTERLDRRPVARVVKSGRPVLVPVPPEMVRVVFPENHRDLRSVLSPHNRDIHPVGRTVRSFEWKILILNLERSLFNHGRLNDRDRYVVDRRDAVRCRGHFKLVISDSLTGLSVADPVVAVEIISKRRHR